MTRRGIETVAAMACLLAGLTPLAGCGHGDTGGGGGAGRRPALAFPVEVAPVETQSVEYVVRAVGSVEAFEEVAVTARVAGVVEAVRFSEGTTVGAGQALVEIEPDRYRLSVESARASVEKAEAQRAEARMALERRQAVNAKNPDLVKAEDVEAFRTQLRVAEADLVEKKSSHELAELNLRDAFVRAPVAGIVQTRRVQTGQYVQPGTVLASMLRRDPLLLRFRVPEPEAAPLLVGMEAFLTVTGDSSRYGARIRHVAAAADPASRMVEVTAEVTDPNRAALRPGAFAQVSVPVGRTGDAPVVPQTAVRPSERGFLAFVVTPDDSVAHERVLTLGLRTADGRVEVRSGVSAGDLLVIRGGEALRDGARVRIRPEGPS